jgi:uracil-DNA glycosylase family 4
MRYSIVSSECSMDARAELRRYLEQRRELGETEILLDQMSAAEALRLLRAPKREGAINAEKPPTDEESLPAPEAQSGDWRSLLHGDAAVQRGLIVGGQSSELFNSDIMRLTSLKAVAKAVDGCTRCPLYKTAKNGVPGEGDAKARLVCVGEAPGANEDASGRPFVGQAGQLLTKILDAVKLTREEVFITNVIKHRPPGNRNPMADEIAACSPYLVRQLELIKPKVIIAFGTFAAQTLLETKTPIGKLRGLVHQYHGIPLVVTYHPAALLRNPAWKRPTWEDVKLARRVLDSATRA